MSVKQIPNLPPVVFLSPTAQLEIVQDGTTYRTSAGQIGALGGFSVVNDVLSNAEYYPIFLRQEAGHPDIAYASNDHYLYNPLEGRLSSLRMESMQGIHLNNSQITLSYTFPTGDNGLSSGPVTVAAGAVVVVPAGSTWKIV